MIEASFNAWQMKETKKDFNGYLEMLGLGKKKTKLSKEMKQTLIDKNVAVAERIRKASLKQRRKL